MRYKFIALILLVSCKDIIKQKPKIVDLKYCIANCVDYEFEKFHNNGKSWGTGSSSMNGLSQKDIYNTVRNHCEEFYKGEAYCNNYRNIKTRLHGYNLGACE